jgi:hypothetical protein
MSLQQNPSATVAPAAPGWTPGLRGLVTDADLPAAELEWPGLRAFFRDLPESDRPPTFLDLVWRFETWRASAQRPS